MEHQNPNSGKRTQCLNSDIISTLPENIIERILTHMPIRDALRTSILSKKWRYSWRGMPKLVFTEDMVEVPSNCLCGELNKYKLVNAIFHVLLLHNGPSILHFDVFSSNVNLGMVSEFDQIISYLSRGNNVRELTITFNEFYYRLPVSFFSLQGLESIHLFNCKFEPTLTINGFKRLRTILFLCVEVSSKMLQQFLSNCPLLESIFLVGECEEDFDFTGGNKFTFVELLQCVPSVKTLGISKYYMKYLCAGGMPRKLPTSLAHLRYLSLKICLMEHDEISSAICIIRSSPVLETIVFLMHDNEKLLVRQTPTNFFDYENHSDLKLDRLETLKIKMSSNLPLEIGFVKLIMAKSPDLKEVRVELNDSLSVDEELKMFRDLVLLPFPRASPSAKLIITR